MTDRELMQQALQALTASPDLIGTMYLRMDAITALRERLAQPGQEQVQEPVAWVTGWHDGHCVIRAVDAAVILPIGTAFYTTPQPRQWVGLTKEEAKEISMANRPYVVDMIAALEARLKEKNT